MADLIGRDETRRSPAGLDCESCEALLAEKLDRPEGLLLPDEEAAFAEHLRSCPGCGELLDRARQGQSWLGMLGKQTPPAPGDLLPRILAQTQGAPPRAAGSGFEIAGAPSARWTVPLLPQAASQHARLLMTAAMAFFSIALTLSVSGVRLTSVHAAELRPQAVQANVSRSFYGTKKQVVSFYENLRVVYEVESKMREMRGDAPPIGEPAPARTEPGRAQEKKHSSGGSGQGGHASSGSGAGDILRGSPLEVAFSRHSPEGARNRAAVVCRSRASHGQGTQEQALRSQEQGVRSPEQGLRSQERIQV